jgi:N-acetylglucosamine-6-sulfatase
MLKLLGVTTMGGILELSIPGIRAAAGERRRPNVVFILSDDHRWDHLGAMGHPFLKTPNLDRLASQGIRFENAFVTTSLCSPSRASFLTGTYPHTHGVKNNITPWTGARVTFLELLKDAGYETAFVGKWHMPGEGLPKLDYLDLFVSFTVKEGQGKYLNCPLIVNGTETPSRKPHITEELTDQAIEFMKNRREDPFCLYLSHKAAHNAYLAARDLDGIYDDEELPLSKDMDIWTAMARGNIYEGHMGLLSTHYRNYCETITDMDRHIGRVLDAIDEMGIGDNTVVIYAGDNGLLWGEHRKINKYWFYEESIRIPLIVRCPWLIPDPGTRRAQMVLNIDPMPTILEICGVPAPEGVEGESLASLFANPARAGREAWLYEYFKNYPYDIPTTFGVRTSTHKYVEFEGGRKPELYNLETDPHEKVNLIGTSEGDTLSLHLKAVLEALKRQ